MCRVVPLLALGFVLGASTGSAQVAANPELRGQAWVNDGALTEGTVVLHHLSNEAQGEVDSTTVDAQGEWLLTLPNVPDPARGDVFFASVRHHGVMYFGPFITQASQLDSLYTIEAYDTLAVAPNAPPLTVDLRATFFEPSSAGWQVTDVFDVLNDQDRTLVPPPGGAVWSYPLPEGATGFTTGAAESGPDAVAFENGSVVLRAPVPPGPRRVAVRYTLVETLPEIPTPGPISYYELFIREPAPAIAVEGLLATERVEIEAGTTYRHFIGENYAGASVVFEPADGQGAPPVEWMAVVLALALAGFGVFTMRKVGTPAAGPEVAPMPEMNSRTALLLEIARLDESFAGRESVSDAERAEYQDTRARLLRQAGSS